MQGETRSVTVVATAVAVDVVVRALLTMICFTLLDLCLSCDLSHEIMNVSGTTERTVRNEYNDDS